MKQFLVTLLLALLALGVAHAQETEEGVVPEELAEQLEEAQGQPIGSLKQAMDALELRNDLLEVLLNKEELTDGDLSIVQQLTDTIENALAKIDEELEIMRERVQEVNTGAAEQERERVRESGKDYLERAKTLMHSSMMQ